MLIWNLIWHPGVWEQFWETLLFLKTEGGWVNLLHLQMKMTPWACLLESGLKLIFHWKAQSLTFFKSSFNSLAEVFTSWTSENNNVSSAKSFTLLVKLSDKSFILIKNNGPRIDPCELQHEHWSMTNFDH